MLKTIVDTNNKKALVTIDGPAVIDYASILKQSFNEAFNSKKSVIINSSKVTECDITMIQLICSLCYSLKKDDRVLEFENQTAAEIILQTIKDSGYKLQCKCTKINNLECIFNFDVISNEIKTEQNK